MLLVAQPLCELLFPGAVILESGGGTRWRLEQRSGYASKHKRTAFCLVPDAFEDLVEARPPSPVLCLRLNPTSPVY